MRRAGQALRASPYINKPAPMFTASASTVVLKKKAITQCSRPTGRRSAKLREIKVEPAAVVLEPMGRDTAPALTLAALQGLESGSDQVLVVLSSDSEFAKLVGFWPLPGLPQSRRKLTLAD